MLYSMHVTNPHQQLLFAITFSCSFFLHICFYSQAALRTLFFFEAINVYINEAQMYTIFHHYCTQRQRST